ncbi:Aldose 1-epimerase, subgroup [Cordyceps fumosorosea ARSEF 2679]|uniref:Aldose 1-epimerase, subgroup n=1 Tax=Cordyceps fumosorosea (strain ARSEF 2679) TaxID=1081104 RepID=A0A167NXL7_CORFA|nr:Aldose 1-epimerase, subgroup [Cordyceps fumosorosea ARSEF 2679]OAA56058.1 Aldose 1-epimerase, subgroup [Cordyceps fumosorosea ARSEF 2679]
MATDATFSFLPLGAIIQTFNVNGINIVQGFPTQELYVKHNSPYFGETIGRVANRIKGARLDSVNGRAWPLAANNSGNTLHGGNVGWGKRIWQGPTPVGVRQIPGVDGLQGGESVQFTLVSADGDEGFPGALAVSVVYTAGTQPLADGREATVLGIEYEARLVGDGADETVINMTNHSYFNLGGADATTIAGTQVTLHDTQYLPVDPTGVPTRGPVAFPGVDVGRPIELGAEAPAFDNCFTTTAEPAAVPVDTRAGPLRLHLAATHPATGIHLQVLSTEPSFQFYTGDFTDAPAVGPGAPARGARSAFCCEPGRWVNAPNVPEWKNMTLLRKGETYGARIVYKAWVE